jgi:chromosome partitioning protein
MTKSIAFHSYKGGTGKTTIAANLAAFLAQSGNNVFLLDLDVYAPSLHTYFDREPPSWLNDYLNNEDTLVKDILHDLTNLLPHSESASSSKGKLYAAFSNPKKEEINKLEAGNQSNSRLQLLRRFIELREELMQSFDADYVVIDTSPGIRHWSINSLAVSDTILLTLKMGDLDVRGTKKMADDIYSSFTDFGAKSFLLMNRVDGFCMPNITTHFHPSDRTDNPKKSTSNNPDSLSQLSKDVGMDILSSIPCYCDIQFNRKEYLTILQFPSHPFAKQIENLANDVHIR